MKVAMVSDWYLPKLGGVETLVHEFSRCMNNLEEVEVEIITQDFSNTLAFQDTISNEGGVKVRRLAGFTIPIWKVYFHPELPFKMKEIFKKSDYDVVHTHHFFTPLSVLSTNVAKRMHPKRECVIATNHTYHARSDSILFKIPKLLTSLAGKSADRVFVGSDAAAKIVREVCEEDKIRKIGYGVPLDGFNPNKKSEELRDELGVGSGIMIFYAGRFGKRKGADYLLQAFKKAEDEMEDATLVLVGKGPEEEKYRKIIRKLDLGDRVRIEGYQPKEKLQEFYASCDFAVFPSVRDESFGRVLPEAMASEKPFIATDIPGFDEVFEEGTGFLVSPRDSEALANKMVELYEDESLRERLGKKGRKVANEKFNWEKIIERTLEIYNEVLS